MEKTTKNEVLKDNHVTKYMTPLLMSVLWRETTCLIFWRTHSDRREPYFPVKHPCNSQPRKDEWSFAAREVQATASYHLSDTSLCGAPISHQNKLACGDDKVP